MSYLDRLKKSANVGRGTLQNHQNPASGGFVGFEGTPPAPFQKIEEARAANDPWPPPPVDHVAEALPDHPDNHRIEQESALKSAAPSCRSCTHLAKPGLASGYCGGGRDDLPPAYGPGHPLRRLPDDQGKSCTTWEAVR